MLVLKIALRELRGGLHDFRLFLGCLIIGVTVIASVGILGSRVEGGIRRESGALLGGDVELSAVNSPATDNQMKFLQSQGKVSLTLTMRAMATGGGDSTLVEFKGVDANYPLLGKAELATATPLQQALGKQRVVVGEDLQERLGVKPGDSLGIGDAKFTIADILKKEPDRIAGAFTLGPRVIASTDDIHKTGLLMPGSFVRYNYRIVLNEPTKMDAFRSELEQRFPHAPWIVKTVNESNRTVRGLVERLQLFLTLAGLSSLLIGGVGILNATESYIGSRAVTIATFKSLGAKRNTVFAIYMTVLCCMTLLGIALSIFSSLLLSSWLLPLLSGFFPVSLEASGDMKPLLLSASFGMLTVLTFSIAAVSRGVEVKPTLLFRGLDMGAAIRVSPGKLALNVLLASMLIGLVFLTSGDRKIAGGFIVAALLCFIVFTLTARLLGFAARRLHLPSGRLRLGIANLHRPGAPVFSIMLSIGIGLSVLVALLLVQGNIERDIQESIPAQAPSLFLIDIQPSQNDELMKLLASKSYVSDVRVQPMVRGRIAKLKGVAVARAPISDEAKWATESDRGFSYAAAMPADTKLTQGKWWPASYHGKTLVSVDRKLAEGMGLKLGDTLTLNITGEDFDATIASLREVNYMNLRINFALVLSPGEIKKFPFNSIATLRVAEEKDEGELVRLITKTFPNISSIRIRESLAQLDEIVSHISLAVRITALFTFICGAMVLASALATALDKRAYDSAMFKVLGAKRRDILAIFLVEWFIIACVTGLLSCLFGGVGAWLIVKRLEWIEFHLLLKPLVEAILFVITFIGITGLLLHSRAFALKPNAVLRNE